jgi:ABC-type molybdenum transport system ATPase subunit/photorepair protein PhrA
MPRLCLPSARAGARGSSVSICMRASLLWLGQAGAARPRLAHSPRTSAGCCIGPNGSGKTQLLKLLAGDVWPSPAAAPAARVCTTWAASISARSIRASRQEIAYLGAERQDRYEHYAWNHSVEAVVGTGLHRTDIPLDVLTAPERQRIATAAAVACGHARGSRDVAF